MAGDTLLGEWLNGNWIPCTDPGCGDGSDVSLGGSAPSPGGIGVNNGGGNGSPAGGPPIFGIGSEAIGGAILAAQGNSQPLQSAALQATQQAAENTAHLPPGAPDPAGDMAVQQLAGSNPCPQ